MADDTKRLPPLNALRAFEAASRHLNFRLAAEELGVTQGAVAQQVRRLEAVLGLKLFDRQARTIALTEPGRSYVSNISRAFELISDATDALKPEPRHLTISVTPTFASRWLIPRLPEFTEVHPDIDLRILATDRVSNFQTDAVDLAVRYGRPPFGPGLVADLLFEQVLVAVASPLLIEKLGPPEELENLRNYALLHDSHDFWPQFLDAAFPGGAVAAAKNIRFNQTSLAIEAAVAGQGLALASLLFVKHDLESRRLVQPFTMEMRTGADFYLVSLRKPRYPTAVREVRDWMSAFR
ncbi:MULTISPECIES: transcriptional regulator GcvA [unclassified Rhizobium]|uniref:transcriptional regulator GcvA n=1 Tax=unclassified Rhizobium TaxID=2613769 RepID=UPI00177C9868|nr:MULTISPECIES: transcriptional regulator GcvA [unclassified Rhizobium]MBD8687202.1 transcriptional regulator GcvA [Rhizobium sp. CFBP 13644]MBD8690995.1 transcriptional regulator GcvA [Rhizobium sp. CFBP 13717]